jgi:superfamily II DNA or RNA helicase
MSPLDFELLDQEGQSEFQRQINRVQKVTGHTQSIEYTVNKASDSIKNGVRSFVIYGEPQSGKTEMMICLTAKLLDDGYKNIVILINDNIELQNQNLERFRKSGLSPAPKSLQEIKKAEALKNTFNTVIFCKKNAKDLKVLNDRLRNINRRVVIDDEADFATPNSKINSLDQSKVNKLVDDLLDTDQSSIYIGVTATPARLDLNNLFENSKSDWVYFKPYPEYSGHDTFFPTLNQDDLAFNLVRYPMKEISQNFYKKR